MTLKKIIKKKNTNLTVLQQTLLKKKTKYQKVITVTGMIFPLILLVVLISTYREAENLLYIVSILFVGFVVVSLVVLILL